MTAEENREIGPLKKTRVRPPWGAARRVVIDRRPRCVATFETVVDEPIRCDKHDGHEGEHESYYGWNGTPEAWT